MKRCWFGAGLLAALLVAGLLVTRGMTKVHSQVASQLRNASAAASAENWTQAEREIREASEQWEMRWHFSAAFADHEPMEEIDGMFAQLAVYLEEKDPAALAALCAQLSRMVEAMGDAHECTWWNLL